jgi:transcriptional regulator with XRE-family HTH domain
MQDVELLKSIGKAVAAKRVTLGLSSKELAFKSEVSAIDVGNLEKNGDWDIDILSLMRIANALETSGSALLPDTEKKRRLKHLRVC